jgi:hypothetical protein
MLILAAWLVACAPCRATPPLVTGDVPTADKEAFEVWLGLRYDAQGDPSSLAWNAGFKHQLTSNLRIFAAVGEGIREQLSVGPVLRVFAGLKYQFDAPWKR